MVVLVPPINNTNLGPLYIRGNDRRMYVHKLAVGAHGGRFVYGQDGSEHWTGRGQPEQRVQLQALRQPVHFLVILPLDDHNFFIFITFDSRIHRWGFRDTNIDAVDPAGQLELRGVCEGAREEEIQQKQPAETHGVIAKRLQKLRLLGLPQAEPTLQGAL